MKFGEVRTNQRRRFSGVRVHQPESRFSAELAAQLLYQRRVAIGDGAIGAQEEQHRRLPLGRQQGI